MSEPVYDWVDRAGQDRINEMIRRVQTTEHLHAAQPVTTVQLHVPVTTALEEIIERLKRLAEDAESTSDMSDMDMAVMYLRHALRHLQGQ